MHEKEPLATIVCVLTTFAGVYCGILLGLPSAGRIMLGASLGILGYLHVIHLGR